MSAQPQETHRRFNSRTASRSMLPSEVDMINHYARKYSTTYKTAPYQAIGGYGSPMTKPNDSASISTSSTPRTKPMTTISHAKRPSNLVTNTNHSLWNDKALATQSQDMESAMETMIASYQTRLQKQSYFLDEIQKEASQNKDFGKLDNADNWSSLEVCHWLSTIHLEKYIQSFADQIIDGSILIRDLDETILITELGVKRIHVKKIMREIVKLREINNLTNTNGGGKDALVESLKLEIQSLQRENKHLREQIKSIQNNSNSNHNYSSNSLNQNSPQNGPTHSHFSSNTSSMSSLPSGAMNGNSSQNYGSSKYGSSSTKTSAYGMHSSTHNYTVNPRNHKKY